MSKGRYPYPEDEFDAAPAADAPVGVHRAPRSWWSRWWPFVAVVVLVPAITVGLVLWASRDGELPSIGGSGSAPSASAPEEPAASPEATEPPGDDAPAADDETPEAPPAPEQTEEPAPPQPEADLSVPVQVLNAARVTGLARGAADDLESAGFTSVTAGNGSASGATKTTVFYGTADLAPTAQRVAEALGVTTVVESSKVAGDGVTVVLLKDFTG